MNQESKSNSQDNKTSIYIVGDNIIDHHLYIKQQEGSDYPALIQKTENGGAHLLYNLIKKFKDLKIALDGKNPLLENYDIVFGHKIISRKIKKEEICRVNVFIL